jgi:hypothetical protein
MLIAESCKLVSRSARQFEDQAKVMPSGSLLYVPLHVPRSRPQPPQARCGIEMCRFSTDGVDRWEVTFSTIDEHGWPPAFL